MDKNTEEIVTEQTEQEKDKRKKLLLPILLIIIALLLVVLIIVLVFGHSGRSDDDGTAFTPVDTIEKIEETESVGAEPAISVNVLLPDGNVQFEGTVDEPAAESGNGPDTETAEASEPTAQPQNAADPAQASDEADLYTGQAHLNVVLTVNDEEHTLLDCDTEITNGVVPDVTLDFTILDFELLPGTYNGIMTVTLPDGESFEQAILVIVREANSGTMSINFNPGVSIDLASGQITCEYSADNGDTHDTTVQLVLLNDGQEYILSQSGVVQPGEKLTGMTLDPDMAGRLSEGIYNGYLRLTFQSDTDDGTTPAVTTDIEVEITVQ